MMKTQTKKHIYCFQFILALLLAIPFNMVNANAFQKVDKTNFKIKRGVNIAIWLSQSGIRGEARKNAFTEKEVKQLANWGFDHFRLPVDEEQLFHEDGTLDMETMGLAENVINWCKKYNLKVIFDLHILRSHNFNNNEENILFTSEAEQNKMCKLWITAAKYLNKYSEKLLAFEIMNEPVAKKDEDWNKVETKVIAALRQINKKRVLVLASNMWDSADHMPALAIPNGDPNIMLTFHFYEPMILTHYTANWTDLKNIRLSHVQYPGSPISTNDFEKLNKKEQEQVRWFYNQTFDKKWMRKRWEKAIQVAHDKGLTLYLGEFGCLPSVGETSRLAWINDVVDLANELHIPHAYWEYKSGFGFCKWQDGSLTNPALLKVLVK
ncbi:MAG: glycoside hydrolase family 5 protein [Bacteroidaceae bacterium]|nr:glycoside hydrolase family 5 protein [Bacteroidaceae bacterium]